jgi:uncharacterized membrane protein
MRANVGSTPYCIRLDAERGTGFMKINVRQIVVAGILGAIAIVLGVTQLGFIPVPNLSGSATIMHVPAILGAVLEGPVVGVLAGLIFGIFSMVQDTTGLFTNPLVSVLPRVLIGITSWYAYKALVGRNQDLAAAVAGVVGTLTNTIFVVGMLVVFQLLPLEVVPTLIPQVIVEVVIAAIVTVVVARGVNLARSGKTTASESSDGNY